MVRPNPATTQIQIVSDEERLEQDVYYQLFDLTGRLIYQDRLMEEVHSLEISDITPGVYILKISDNRQTLKTFKIVKQ